MSSPSKSISGRPSCKGLRPAGLIRDPEHAKRLDDIGALRISRDGCVRHRHAGALGDRAGGARARSRQGDPAGASAPTIICTSEISKNPTRFAGFAALPVSDPKAAADELERAVTKLGFKGAMFMGLCKGRFLDEKFFWPIFERAEKLDVPVYLHPSKPHQAVIDAYFKDHPSLIGPSLGFGNEVLTMAARLVVGGVLDAYPKLKVIIGHLGEGLPFLQWRMDRSLARDAKLPKSFTDYVKQHFWITTSGAFSDTALLCSIAELGIDKVIFSVDYPYVKNEPGRKWLDALPITEQQRAQIASGNVKKLLKL